MDGMRKKQKRTNATIFESLMWRILLVDGIIEPKKRCPAIVISSDETLLSGKTTLHV
jgi:hypothetical protein